MQKPKWELEFDKQLTQSYSGDSGFNGGDPQEPVYDWACYPNDVKAFIRPLLRQVIDSIPRGCIELLNGDLQSTEVLKASLLREWVGDEHE